MMSLNMQLEASLSVIYSATKVTRKTNTCMLVHVFDVMVSNIEAFLTNITIEAIKSCVNLHVAEEARLCRVISVTFRTFIRLLTSLEHVEWFIVLCVLVNFCATTGGDLLTFREIFRDFLSTRGRIINLISCSQDLQNNAKPD